MTNLTLLALFLWGLLLFGHYVIGSIGGMVLRKEFGCLGTLLVGVAAWYIGCWFMETTTGLYLKHAYIAPVLRGSSEGTINFCSNAAAAITASLLLCLIFRGFQSPPAKPSEVRYHPAEENTQERSAIATGGVPAEKEEREVLSKPENYFCDACGREREQGDIFCQGCGKKFPGDSAS